ncbi:hypothetical protein U1Q18_025131 [Sarracenia purpurea var. burkii]
MQPEGETPDLKSPLGRMSPHCPVGLRRPPVFFCSSSVCRCSSARTISQEGIGKAHTIGSRRGGPPSSVLPPQSRRAMACFSSSIPETEVLNPG